ncbi:MAG: tetratricopeptide repeat protein, partial [Chloroflexota bacterium]
HGAPGNGTSTIAATLASAYTQQGSGGALWLNVDDDSLAAMIVRVGRAYGDLSIANADDPTAMAGAAGALLAQNRPLVVLDGNPLMPAVTEFVGKVASGLPVMITADGDSPGTWASVAVPVLSDADATTLFTEKSSISTGEVPQIVSELGAQPFALVIAAGTARIAKMDGGTLLGALQAAPGAPHEKALQVGLTNLQAAFQGILLMLGATFNGSASIEMMSMLSNAPAETVQKVMAILAAAGFVQQDKRYEGLFYSLHPLTHSYAQTFLRNSGRLDALRDKVRETTLAYARKHTGTSAGDHNALAVEMDAFLATSNEAAERGEIDVASQIQVALTHAGDFVRGRGYLYELLQLKEGGSSVATPFAANPEVPADVANLFGDFTDAPDEPDYVEDDEIDAAESAPSPEDMFMRPPAGGNDADSLRGQIAAARGAGDNDRVLELQERLGTALRSAGKDTEALGVYNDLLASYEDADDRPKTLNALRNLSEIMVKQENSQAAVLHARRGARLAEELSDEASHAQMLRLLGDAQQQLGESTDAILAYSHGLDLAKTTSNRDLEGEIMMQLGFAQLDDDDTETAIKTWDGALALCRELNKRDCEGRILGGLGTAYGELERWEEAINFHTSAMHIAREVKDRKEEGLQLSNLGYAAKQANKLPQSVISYRQALHVAYVSDERDNIVSTIVDLARLLVNSAQHLEITDLLVNDALERDSSDREVVSLKERVSNEKIMAASQGITFKPVNGTAQVYASNAYALLDS